MNMTKSILYKEWIKSRWVVLIIIALFVGILCYSFMGVAQSIRLNGYGQVWDTIIQKRITYFNSLKYLPILSGVLLALSQYSPEMSNKRLKLTLHLPMSESRVILTMLGYGVLVLSATFAISYLAIAIGMNYHFDSQVAIWNLASVLPWLVGGLVGYLLSCWICIEPVWRQRAQNAIIALVITSLFYLSVDPKSYTVALPIFAGIALLLPLFTLYSLVRFKDGEQ